MSYPAPEHRVGYEVDRVINGALQGDESAGVDYLEKAVARGLSDVALLERGKCMAALRKHPRVEALIRNMSAR